MKFGRIIPQENVHEFIESDFRFDITLSRWWNFMQHSAGTWWVNTKHLPAPMQQYTLIADLYYIRTCYKLQTRLFMGCIWWWSWYLSQLFHEARSTHSALTIFLQTANGLSTSCTAFTRVGPHTDITLTSSASKRHISTLMCQVVLQSVGSTSLATEYTPSMDELCTWRAVFTDVSAQHSTTHCDVVKVGSYSIANVYKKVKVKVIV